MKLAHFVVIASTLFGCATYSSTARDQFVSTAPCPADQVTVFPAPNADDDRIVRGCGKEIRYTCETKYSGEGRRRTNFPVCSAR